MLIDYFRKWFLATEQRSYIFKQEIFAKVWGLYESEFKTIFRGDLLRLGHLTNV